MRLSSEGTLEEESVSNLFTISYVSANLAL